MKKFFSLFILLIGISAIIVMADNMVIDNKIIKLPSPDKRGVVTLEEAINKRKSIRSYLDLPLNLDEISQILWAANGKNKWDRITSPSAGGKYPFAIYLLAINVKGLPKGIYLYNNSRHSLDVVSLGDFKKKVVKASHNQACLDEAGAIIVMCADYSITIRKYGRSARRWVDMEAGHIGQNIYLQASALEVGTVAIGGFKAKEIKEILELDREPVYMMPLGRIAKKEDI